MTDALFVVRRKQEEYINEKKFKCVMWICRRYVIVPKKVIELGNTEECFIGGNC